MIVIRNAQIEALGQEVFRGFVDRTERALRETDPELTAGWSSEVLRAFIESGVALARSHGIDAGGDVRKFLRQLLRYGEALSPGRETPELKRILEDESMDGWERVQEIEYHLGSAGPAGR